MSYCESSPSYAGVAVWTDGRSTAECPQTTSSNKLVSVLPILRWAGSKKKLLPVLEQSAPNEFGRYIEPFFGSGVLFLKLNVQEATVADINPNLIQAYEAVRTHPKAIWSRLNAMPTNEDFYYELRSQREADLGKFDRAARFIYLNRFCFNGVYRTNQQGQFNVSRGAGGLNIPVWDAFRNFSDRIKNVDLQCKDFETIVDGAKKGDFVYLDPPYAEKGKRDRGEYGPNTFKCADVARLIQSIKRADRRGAKVLLSYSAFHLDLAELRGWHVREISVMRNVAGFGQSRKRAQEILVSNYT